MALYSCASGGGAGAAHAPTRPAGQRSHSQRCRAGDVNDASGFSPFPGNINQLVVKLDTYAQQLEATGGVIAEFVNPKFKDAARTAFKKPTRLECMMQDYPKALPATATVGFTTIKEVRPAAPRRGATARGARTRVA